MEEQIELESWKGKDKIQIEEFPDTFRVIEHRKCKEDGKIDETIHTIPAENVRVLWDIIRKNCEVGEVYGYRFLVRKLLEHYKFHEQEGIPLEVFMDAWNGGKNRSRFYFPHLYFPIKCCEMRGWISYLGRGGIIRRV